MNVTRTIAASQVGHMDLSACVLVEPETPVQEVLQRMRTASRTIALVAEQGRLVGIFTERDVLQKVAAGAPDVQRPVRELMTPDPTTISPAQSLKSALRAMNAGHYRDLPVVDESGKILGNLTHDAIVRHLCDGLQAEVLNLPPDPDQVPKSVEGA